MGWWNMKTAREVEQPMASSLLLRRAAIEDIGVLFDEQFPIFFNDVDLCWRLWQKNWPVWFVPTSQVKHWGGASTRLAKPAMIAESHRAMEAFYKKHGAMSTRCPCGSQRLHSCARPRVRVCAPRRKCPQAVS
jgi:GT2 family glycosyltransferase